MKNNKLKAVSLFCGAGGLDLGAEMAGTKIIFANDIDPDSCKTYQKNFPDTEVVEGDIKDIDNFPKADILLGGYPCQSFSLGGNRNPENDHRTYLYLQYARVLEKIQPKYFIAENVSGLTGVMGGKFFKAQLEAFQNVGKHGYTISRRIVDARDYGLPQKRRRVFLIGVRKDIEKAYIFPEPSHGKKKGLKPYASHGEAIRDLPLDPKGEYYHRPHDPDGGFSWYYMSRNRKADWDEPSYTIVANWRHTPMHPASSTMKLVWSDLKNGWKQKWEFSKEYEHLIKDPTRPKLEKPRRLSWRECARIQTFPDSFIFEGKVESKFNQIGNAVPPMLARIIIEGIVAGKRLGKIPKEAHQLGIFDC